MREEEGHIKKGGQFAVTENFHCCLHWHGKKVVAQNEYAFLIWIKIPFWAWRHSSYACLETIIDFLLLSCWVSVKYLGHRYSDSFCSFPSLNFKQQNCHGCLPRMYGSRNLSLKLSDSQRIIGRVCKPFLRTPELFLKCSEEGHRGDSSALLKWFRSDLRVV